MTTSKNIKLFYYRAAGQWYAALWVNEEFDTTFEVDVGTGADEQAVRQQLEEMPLRYSGPRKLMRVYDVR